MDATHKSHLTLKTGDELPVTVHIDYQPREAETLECPEVPEDAVVLSVILDRTGKEIDCRWETEDRFRQEFLESLKDD